MCSSSRRWLRRHDYMTGVLVPAIEVALALRPTTGEICEVAAWKPTNGYARRLNVRGASLWCHFMTEADYRLVADPADYTR